VKLVALAPAAQRACEPAAQLASPGTRGITKLMPKVVPRGCGAGTQVTSAARQVMARVRAALGRQQQRGSRAKRGTE
jgi:hypothetical protein